MNKYEKPVPIQPIETDAVIVRPSTGEIFPLYEGTRIIQPKKQYQTSDGRLLCKPPNHKETFCKMIYDSTRVLKYALTPKEQALLFELATYMHMTDGIIVINNQYANIKDMSVALEVDYDGFRKIIKKYEALDIVHKFNYNGVNTYCINPFLFMNGEYITCDLINEFGHSIWATKQYKNMKKKDFQEMLKNKES